MTRTEEVLRKIMLTFLEAKDNWFKSCSEMFDSARVELSKIEAERKAMSEPITEEWLESIGFCIGTIYATLIVTAVISGEPVKLWLTEEHDAWGVSLSQSVGDGSESSLNDDVIALTGISMKSKGQLVQLTESLGASLKLPVKGQ